MCCYRVCGVNLGFFVYDPGQCLDRRKIGSGDSSVEGGWAYHRVLGFR